MTSVTFGSAHLLVNRMPQHMARALLHAALEAGATRLDTAPLYGHGGSEALVAAVAAARPGTLVTTKVGLEPQAEPPLWRWAAGRVLHRVPALALAARSLRGRAAGQGARNTIDAQAAGPSGRFGSVAVRDSIERSLQRLGPIDRLLLHEVHPADITDTLLELLHGYQRRGDVAALGVATGNAVTAQALQRGQGLFTVAHVSADAWAAPVLPAQLAGLLATAGASGRSLHVVGHGVLGAEGRTLAGLRQRLRADAACGARWREAVAGSRFADSASTTDTGMGGGSKIERDTDTASGTTSGLPAALCARAAAQGFTELLVATRRPTRVAPTVHAAASAHQPLPAAAAAVLDSLLADPP